MKLRAYSVEAELHGILIFSSEFRPALGKAKGSLIVTAPVIHNYPLLYGLLGIGAESYAVISSLHRKTYQLLELKEKRHRRSLVKGELQYNTISREIQRFFSGEQGSIYSFPLAPVEITRRKFFMAAKGVGYAEYRARLKSEYPRTVTYIALVPPSRFRGIIVTAGRELPSRLVVRIGMKRMGVLKLNLKPLIKLNKLKRSEWTTVPVNLYDLKEMGYTPEDANVVLETRSKPPSFPDASILAYVRASGLYELRTGGHYEIVPLPSWVASNAAT